MIDKIENADLKNMQEELLKNMKMLRHTVADMLGSKSFLKDIDPGAQNGVITVYGEQFPIYVTSATLAADDLPEITDDIYDEDNYLSLISDDDLLWYALVEHLAHQADLLQEDNNQLREDLTAADNEIEGLEESLREANKKCTEYARDIDKLEVDNKRLSERVKTLVIEKTNRPDTAEKVSDPKEDSSNTDLDLEIIRLLTRITELENENESLKKKLFSGVPTKFGEQERGTPEDKVVRMDLDTALMQQQIANLNTRIAQLEEKLKSTETELTTAMNANGILKTKIAVLTDEKREAQLLAYRLTSGEMSVQFDDMKLLEHENGVLKNENAELNQKLYQKEDEDDLKKKIAEYAQKNDDLLERNKRLNQEINKFRVQLNSYSGVSVVNNDDMQQKITKETFAELTARINELETTLKDKDERINQLSKNNAALSVENKNISDLLREADRNVRFYVREVDNLEKEIKDLQAKALSDGEDIIDENHDNKPEKFGEATRAGEAFAQSIEMDMETAMLLQENTKLKEQIENLQKDNEDFERVAAAHLETTAKFADYKERQKRLYKHFRNLAEMIEDLMELG